MDFLDIATTVLGSMFSGGLTGIIGTAVQLFAKHKQRQQDIAVLGMRQAHELAKLDKEADIVAAEWAGRDKVAMTEADAAKDVAASNAFAESFKMLPQRFATDALLNRLGPRTTVFAGILFVFVDVWRALIRPGMTTYLAVLVTLIYFQLLALRETYMKGAAGGEVIPWAKVDEMLVLIVSTVLYLLVTYSVWWCGTRNKQEPPPILKG